MSDRPTPPPPSSERPTGPNPGEGMAGGNPRPPAPAQAAYPGQPTPFRPAPAGLAAPAVAYRPEGGFKRGFGIGSGVGLGLGASLLVLTLVSSLLSALLFAGFAAAASRLAGPAQLDAEGLQTVWGPPTATQELRAIPVAGPIMAEAADGLALTGGTYGYEVADVLDGLTAEDAGGVVLLINTPGGSINGSKAMADAIDRYRERTGRKVFAYVQGTSASGGMYTMAGADEVVADHGSLIGSVGVIMGPLSEFTDVVAIDGGLLGEGVTTTGGITQEYITAGRGKDVGNPFRPLTDEERAMLQSFVDQEYEAFVGHVASKREIPASRITDELGAAMLGTERAKEVGYIDDVLGRPEAFRHFAEAAGLDPDDTRLVQSAGPGFWALVLGAEARPWGVAPAAEPVGGQPARATSTLCTSTRTPLAWYGPTNGVCG